MAVLDQLWHTVDLRLSSKTEFQIFNDELLIFRPANYVIIHFHFFN